MLITPTTKSITEYALTLSQADAELAMADPYSFGDKIAEQLRAAGVAAPNGNGRAKSPHKPGKNHPLGFRAQTRKQVAARGRTAPTQPRRTLGGEAARPKVRGRLSCPHCDKQFTSRAYLDRHLFKKHGLPESTAAEPTASAA